jgi:Cap4 dsDNA endonuclease
VTRLPRRSPPRKLAGRLATNQSDALDDLLAADPNDETGGSDGSLGFSFQQWWAAFTIVELLALTDDDFAVGMEIKEDVAILNSRVQPTTIEFCQIKKNERDATWSLKELHRAKPRGDDSKPAPSALAKLYYRRHQFSAHATKLRFVSNVGFKVPIASSGMVNSHACDIEKLHEESLRLLKEALSKQLDLDVSTIKLENFFLHRTDLPLRRPHLMVGGLLSENSNSERIPFPIPRPTVAARILASEVQDRGSNTSYSLTLKDLQSRMISRADALAILAQVATSAKAPLQDILDQAVERLNMEGHSFIAVKLVQDQRVPVCAAAVDRTNSVFWSIAAALNSVRPLVTLNPKSPKMGDLMMELIDKAKSVESANLDSVPGYTEAIALLVLYEAINVDTLTLKTGAQLEEKK